MFKPVYGNIAFVFATAPGHVFKMAEDGGSPVGMAMLIKNLSLEFPRLIHGYFNPPKENYGR